MFSSLLAIWFITYWLVYKGHSISNALILEYDFIAHDFSIMNEDMSLNNLWNKDMTHLRISDNRVIMSLANINWYHICKEIKVSYLWDSTHLLWWIPFASCDGLHIAADVNVNPFYGFIQGNSYGNKLDLVFALWQFIEDLNNEVFSILKLFEIKTMFSFSRKLCLYSFLKKEYKQSFLEQNKKTFLVLLLFFLSLIFSAVFW